MRESIPVSDTIKSRIAEARKTENWNDYEWALESLEIAISEIERAKRFCTWLSEDSHKYPHTDAGQAGRSLKIDFEKALQKIKGGELK